MLIGFLTWQVQRCWVQALQAPLSRSITYTSSTTKNPVAGESFQFPDRLANYAKPGSRTPPGRVSVILGKLGLGSSTGLPVVCLNGARRGFNKEISAREVYMERITSIERPGTGLE